MSVYTQRNNGAGFSPENALSQRWAVGSWQLAVGSWQLAVGSWQLAVGSWQLAVGSWQLKNRKPSVKKEGLRAIL
ncbi:hypothetical protein AXW28_02845 [Yersinia ruckeri]|nr:hypothetical protein AXW28_02845 [Yersinia ruckeri]OJC51554.1 hypothetical protein AXW35_02850 [Yersinia ruckeri]